jgi:hypothetical protein
MDIIAANSRVPAGSVRLLDPCSAARRIQGVPVLIRDGEDFLELAVTDRGAAGSPDVGDTRFAVRVRVTSKDTVFTGETWCWVERRVLSAFAQQLRELEERRQGPAALESMSPGELKLEVRSTDRAGHVAAFGQVGHWCYGGADAPHWSAVTFGIPFCPSELAALVREFGDLAVAPDT